jgi:hypothetical protein
LWSLACASPIFFPHSKDGQIMHVKPQRLIPLLAIVAATAVGAAPSASAATTDVQQADSANWAGYVVGNSSGGGGQFSTVSGSWVQPSVQCSSGQSYSAFWVGLGGSGQQSGSLEQTGTEADCTSSGAVDDFAWYELVPAAPVRLDLAMHPGDHVTGKVTVNGTQVIVALSDQTTGGSVTKTLQMSNPDASTAEWIAEAPSTCDQTSNCQPLPLGDFNSVNFTNASATAGGHTGTISDPSWTADAVTLDGGGDSGLGGAGFAADQSSAGAQPSALSSDGSSFSVAYSSTGGQSTAAGGGAGDGGGDPATGSGFGSGAGSGYGGYGYGDGGGSGGYGGYGFGYGGQGYFSN